MKHIFANWKMYLNLQEAIDLAKNLAKKEIQNNVNLSVFPSDLAFSDVVQILEDEEISFGVQNVSDVPKGAYTGAVSADIYSQAGAQYALVGHSERRHVFGESLEATKNKVLDCIESGITPVLCIGETQKDLESGNKEKALRKQLDIVFNSLDGKNTDIMIGYEPVWAIGEGSSECDPDTAEQTHQWIHDYLEIDSLDILYGGSVEAHNVNGYLSKNCIDGVLIGHAGADFNQFSELIKKLS